MTDVRFTPTVAGEESLAGIEGNFELVSGDESVALRVAGGRLNVTDGPLERPDARLTTDPRIMFRIAAGGTSLQEEVAAGRARVEGNPDGIELLEETLRLR